MKKIQDAQIEAKNVLVRIDADVPMAKEWTDGNTREINDDERLRASIPTIQFLLEKGAQKISIIGHIDRPKGMDFKYCLWPVANRLAKLLGLDHKGKKFAKPQQTYDLNEKIIIFENLRFNPGEEQNDPEFAKQLAQDQDIFVQDAFATCHRAHASTVGVAKLLPSYAGLAVQNEVENLSKILATPKDGFTIIIGGKKAEDKLPVIENLFNKAENFLIGGVVANTFLAAEGYDLGGSLVEKEVFGKTKKIINMFNQDQSRKFLLPVELVFSRSREKPLDTEMLYIGKLSGPTSKVHSFNSVDIGPETIEKYKMIISESKTIFWNGNMGISEVEEFAKGTREIAEAIVLSSAKKYAGGGDTTSFLRRIGIADKFDYVSHAGGATLEFLAGKKLPGLEVLE